MELNKIYDEPCNKQVMTSGDKAKVRTGLFKEDDLVLVMPGAIELYFKIDKNGFEEILNSVIARCEKITYQNDYQKMYETLNIIETEINNFFGLNQGLIREQFYLLNGDKSIIQDASVCSMSQIKGLGIAKCAEKASVTNNILLALKQMKLFDYDVNYIKSLVTINNSVPDGHAFLEFSRTNAKNEISHLIYDVTNPEIILSNGVKCNYPAIYHLNDNEYKDFLNGKAFDNTHFILYNNYKPIEKREYFGFKPEEQIKTNGTHRR